MRRTNGQRSADATTAQTSTVKAQHRAAFAHHAVVRYVLIGVLAPLVDTALVLLLAIPVGIFHLIVRIASPLARRKLLGYLLHAAMMYALLYTLATCIDVRCVVYLFASRLFFCGWLGHPLLAFWCTVHRSHRNSADGDAAASCQPTSSIYGPVMAFFSMNECYHVEHHDFPTIAASRLPELHRIAREYYAPLPHSLGWLSTLRDYFVNRHDFVYSCQ